MGLPFNCSTVILDEWHNVFSLNFVPSCDIVVPQLNITLNLTGEGTF